MTDSAFGVAHLATAAIASAICGVAAHAEMYQWMNDPAAYGYFCQYSIPNALSQASCSPAANTNTLNYLQNTYAAQLGSVQLVGSGYSGWNATAQSLQAFFGTTEAGSPGPGQTAGLQNYLASVGAASLTTSEAIAFNTDDYPDWVQQNTVVTFGDFYGWLSGGGGVNVSMQFGGGTTGPGGVVGHNVSLVGLEWDDTNGDGVVDQSEGATFLVIDPLDPSENYAGSDVLGPPKVTTISVWQAGAGQLLQFSYLQYWGSLPFDGSNYQVASGAIGGGISTMVIPAPAVGAVIAALGLVGSRRRR